MNPFDNQHTAQIIYLLTNRIENEKARKASEKLIATILERAYEKGRSDQNNELLTGFSKLKQP
jgi:hypothetical protein